MRVLLFLLALTAASPAHALAQRQSGMYLDLGAGMGAGGRPLGPGPALVASLGWWAGPYDDAYSFGRFWAAGLSARQDWVRGAPRTAALFELRRGMDLVVVGLHGFLAAGALLPSRGTPVGLTVRAGAGVKLRRTPYWGISLRLEAGLDRVEGELGGTLGMLLSGSFARPWRRPDL